MKVLAVTSYKGGVAKTTTAINVAACLVATGKRVLVVDSDQQANSTFALGCGLSEEHNLGAFLLAGPRQVRQWPMHPVSAGLDLLPSHRLLDEYLSQAERKPHYETLLRDRLAQLPAGAYDYVVIDCPPALHTMTWNALCAADGYLVPIEPEPFAVLGLAELMPRANRVRDTVNPNLHLVGFVFTRYNPAQRGQLRQQLAADVSAKFGADTVLGNVRVSVALTEAHNERQTVLAYAPESVGAKDYQRLTSKILPRL